MTSLWRICFSAAVALLTLSVAAAAAEVGGSVELVSPYAGNVHRHKDDSGVVVWLEPLDGAPVLPADGAHARMIQKNKTFTPHVLAVTVGTIVDFPNYDPIFHNAFSNYNGQIFDIGLYPPGTTRSIAFRREGVVRVFCNIHPSMSAVIVVLKTPYFAVTQKDGAFRIAGVPLGGYRMHLFHERATDRAMEACARTISVSGDVQTPRMSVSESGYLELPHKNKYGKDYPPEADSGSYVGTKP
ncbi:MAG TPA: methylamine utilization protein [Bryobacteraceae bacterium]|nr:methylamine utilization protein [Bryobacteraceae bacterium]